MYKQLIVILVLIGLISCGDGGVNVSKTELGNEWLFMVEVGIVDCVDGNAAIFIFGENTYAINGPAMAAGFKSINSIWLSNPSNPGVKVSVGPVLELALGEC